MLATVLSAGLAAATGGWSAPKRLPKSAFTTVSCPSTKFCMAAGQPVAVFGGRSWTIEKNGPTAMVKDDSLLAVSCSGRTFCVSVDRFGNVFVFHGRSSKGADEDRCRDGQGRRFAVSSASPRSCALVDIPGDAYRFNGKSWSKATHTGAGPLTTVSCPTAGFCMAIDRDRSSPPLYERSMA